MGKRVFGGIVSFSLAWFFIAGCNNEEIWPLDIEFKVSDAIKTVVTLKWNSETPVISYVEYGESKGFGSTTPIEEEPSTGHEAILLGLAEETRYFFRIVSQYGDELKYSQTESITTGSLPPEIPFMEVTGSGQDRYLVVPISGAVNAPVIINPDGEVVWYYLEDSGNLVLRALLSVDGESILYNTLSSEAEIERRYQIIRLSLDGSERVPMTLMGRSHDFIEHPDGTLGILKTERATIDGREVMSDKIIETYSDGSEEVIWSASDCFTFDGWPEAEYPPTFGNALDYDPVEEVYYAGFRGRDCIVKIDRSSGSCEWIFGGSESTFSFSPGSARFKDQHQFDIDGQTILVFDNEGSESEISRVIEYSYNEDYQTAKESWIYTSQSSLFSPVFGDVSRLDNGEIMVTWSFSGQIERLNEEREVEWTINLELGHAFGYASILNDLYTR